MLSVTEREFVVVVSCFKFVLCHSNVSLCVPGCCCDCGFVDHVTCKTRTIERAKVLFLQLHFLSLLTPLFSFRIFWLWLLMMFAMLVVQLQLTFKLFLLKILWSLCDLGKCLSTSYKKDFATFVSTFWLKGGLNQIMFLGLFVWFLWFWFWSYRIFSL